MKKKNVVKVAKKAYKKLPKKKILAKAAGYGVKQMIGSTYLGLFSSIYKGSKQKALSMAGDIAYRKLLESKYIKDKINTLPIATVSLVVRLIINFLVLSRIVTHIWWLDFLVSVIFTVITTLLSPFIYVSIQAHEEMFMIYTDKFTKRLMGDNVGEYLEMLKNIALGITGVIVMIILQFVEVTSRSIQIGILHSMISGTIADIIQRAIDSYLKPIPVKYSVCYLYPEGSQRYKLVRIIPKHYQICNTRNRIIIGLKPKRGKVVTI